MLIFWFTAILLYILTSVKSSRLLMKHLEAKNLFQKERMLLPQNNEPQPVSYLCFDSNLLYLPSKMLVGNYDSVTTTFLLCFSIRIFLPLLVYFPFEAKCKRKDIFGIIVFSYICEVQNIVE